MRFLADESCDFAVVRALRGAGHDVLAVAEITPSADDEDVLQSAAEQDRILITEDKDFGQLVFANKKAFAGVLLIRFPSSARSGLPCAVLEFVDRRGSRMREHFAVLKPGRARIVKRL